MDSALVRAYRDVWKGCREDVIGTYVISGSQRSDGKREGKATTKQEELADLHFEEHLNGDRNLGLVPISPPDAVRWAAIDIDDYHFDHAHFSELIAARGLPIVHCRSKSGGAHLYFFFSEVAVASEIRDELTRLAAEMGYAGSEIFPKQDIVDEDLYGNWINLPYSNINDPEHPRYALRPGTEERLDVEQFIELVERNRITVKQLKMFRFVDEMPKEQEAPDGFFFQGPPCLAAMSSIGVPSGGRNNFMYAVGVYLHKAYPEDEIEAQAKRYNEAFNKPPLSEQEVQRTVRSAGNSAEARYNCKQEPLKSFCNAKECVRRKFGIGEPDDGFPAVLGVQTLPADKSVFWFTLEGFEDQRIKLTAADIASQAKFKVAMINTLHTMPPTLKAKDYEKIMNDALKGAQTIEMSIEERLHAGGVGTVMGFLLSYIEDRDLSEDLEQIFMGNPVRLPDDRIALDQKAFIAYLRRHNFREMSDQDVYIAMKESTAVTREVLDIDGKSVSAWVLANTDAGSLMRKRMNL